MILVCHAYNKDQAILVEMSEISYFIDLSHPT